VENKTLHLPLSHVVASATLSTSDGFETGKMIIEK